MEFSLLKHRFETIFSLKPTLNHWFFISRCHVSSPEDIQNRKSSGTSARKPGECDPARNFATKKVNWGSSRGCCWIFHQLVLLEASGMCYVCLWDCFVMPCYFPQTNWLRFPKSKTIDPKRRIWTDSWTPIPMDCIHDVFETNCKLELFF